MATDSGSNPNNPRPELVDFVYRDNPRIASLTAQLFGGHLTSSKVTQAGKDASEASGSGGFAPFATGGYKAANESTRSIEDTRNPHDAAAADLIASLVALNRVSDNVRTAKPGTVIRVEGTLFLIDGAMMKMASFMIQKIPDMEALGQAMEAMYVPGAFILRTSIGDLAGTLDATGLHEPIGSTYFKHGSDGITGVGLVGIREGSVPNPAAQAEDQNLFGAIQQYASTLRTIIFPSDAIRVAPIALYRKLN